MASLPFALRSAGCVGCRCFSVLLRGLVEHRGCPGLGRDVTCGWGEEDEDAASLLEMLVNSRSKSRYVGRGRGTGKIKTGVSKFEAGSGGGRKGSWSLDAAKEGAMGVCRSFQLQELCWLELADVCGETMHTTFVKTHCSGHDKADSNAIHPDTWIYNKPSTSDPRVRRAGKCPGDSRRHGRANAAQIEWDAN